jgi:hypothetical protein
LNFIAVGGRCCVFFFGQMPKEFPDFRFELCGYYLRRWGVGERDQVGEAYNIAMKFYFTIIFLIIEKMEEIDCLRSCEGSKLVRLGLGIT